MNNIQVVKFNDDGRTTLDQAIENGTIDIDNNDNTRPIKIYSPINDFTGTITIPWTVTYTGDDNGKLIKGITTVTTNATITIVNTSASA